MFEYVSKSEFINRFLKHEERNRNFSYEGLVVLFEYLENWEEETGEKIEFDMVGICCDYVEYDSIEDYVREYDVKVQKKNYKTKDEYNQAVIEHIQDNTKYIPIPDTERFIIMFY